MSLDQFFSDFNKVCIQGAALMALLNMKSAMATLNNQRKTKKRSSGYPPLIRDNSTLRKYWYKRYSLFSKYDEGIQLDEESWYSVTPEQVAKQTASRCKCDTIIDAFCGAGGNAIQFAFTCKRVIAIDIDPHKIVLAMKNAKIYGVLNKITFICGDFFHLAKMGILKGDVVFLSPPWGGPAYHNMKQGRYDLEKMPIPFSQLLASARGISLNVGAFLPRNCNKLELLNTAFPGDDVDVEENTLSKKPIGLTVYYNALVKYK